MINENIDQTTQFVSRYDAHLEAAAAAFDIPQGERDGRAVLNEKSRSFIYEQDVQGRPLSDARHGGNQ